MVNAQQTESRNRIDDSSTKASILTVVDASMGGRASIVVAVGRGGKGEALESLEEF